MATLGGKREGAGRPKGYASLEAERARVMIAKMLSTELKPIALKAIKDAKKGDKFARDWLSDRAYGKARQVFGVEGGEEGEPLRIEISETIAKKNKLI